MALVILMLMLTIVTLPLIKKLIYGETATINITSNLDYYLPSDLKEKDLNLTNASFAFYTYNGFDADTNTTSATIKIKVGGGDPTFKISSLPNVSCTYAYPVAPCFCI